MLSEQNANKKSSDGYYTMCSVYVRSDTPMEVSLSPAVEVSQGVSGAGTYVVGTPCTGSASVHWEVVCFAEIP